MKLTVAATTVLLAAGMFAGAAQAAGDAAKGKTVFKKCAACHSFDAEQRKPGPTLAGLFGRKAGVVEGFKYSKDMVAAGEAGLVWNEQGFVDYMADPKGYIGSFIDKKKAATRMAFAGLRKESERDDLLAYMLEQTK
tara:strand:- start:22684 stop:23094 length:411 start_codon:yes stop_codon:yes gene_type:complete